MRLCNKSTFKLACLVACASLISISGNSYAIDAKRNLPISIESDSALLDDSKGISTYTGNVVIAQGDSVVKADKISVTAVDRKITTITALGQPAFFSQNDAELGQTQGQANKIVYIANDAILRFEGEAMLEQTTNSFSGENIEYDIVRKAIRAEGDEDSGSRVKIIYTPEAESESESESEPTTADGEEARSQDNETSISDEDA